MVENILLKDILKNKMYPEAGAVLFEITQQAILLGNTVSVDMSEVESVPTVFMNTSFGDLIALFGVDETKKVFAFKNITKSQIQKIQKYFIDYEGLIRKDCSVRNL